MGDPLRRLHGHLRAHLRRDQLISDPTARLTYDCDALTTHRSVPGLVVLPESVEDVALTVRACADHGVPFVARGAGTGLSGGALADAGAVVVALARMNRIIQIDAENGTAVVEPGVTNLDITRAAAPFGLYFAPDPSSQQVCTIGGNVSENSGGAHCLKYGFTTNHVTGLQVVLPDGDVVELGGAVADPPGYDLVGAFVGSEGTLGIATKITVRLLRRADATTTLLAAFDSVAAAGAAVSAIIADGIVPAAVELMDALALEAVERAVGSAAAPGTGAVLIVELDGHRADVAADEEAVVAWCEQHGAVHPRVAADDGERAQIWKARKAAFAAVGRISPDYYVQDGVVPRSALPYALNRITDIAHRSGLRVANVFHAGDGNLHPLVLFDGAVAGQAELAEGVAGSILDLCLALGGSVTGEHGVGVDKREHLGRMFSTADLDAMRGLRCAFDPAGLANPGKVFPTPRMCREGAAAGRRAAAPPLGDAVPR